jgi:hypothetical protein
VAKVVAYAATMRPLRAGLASIAALTLLTGLSLATPSLTLAASGFVEKASTTYVVNPGKDRLDVTIDLTFRNTKHSNATTIFYYDGDYLWLERDATAIRATSPGATVVVSRVKRSGQYDEYKFRWSPVLFYGKTRALHITYQIPTGAPRSSSWFRISPAYLDFCVIGTGLDGGSTSIRLPLAYQMTIDTQEGGALGSRIEGDTRVYTTGTLDRPYQFWACLTGEQPNAFHTTSITSPSGREIDIQSWPNDLTWGTQISSQIDDVLSRLEALIGRGLPGDGPIAVREVGAGTLGQYAGFFDPDTGVARIGEDLKATGLVTHELSHAWFNGDLFQEHWLSEGYAEWARISIGGDTCPIPASYPGDGAPNLEQWQFIGPRATDQEVAVVDWQYSAACALVSQVAAKIGPDKMRLVLAALLDHQLPYRSGDAVLTGSPVAASWKGWLDAVDELGLADPSGEASVADLLAPYGITNGSTQILHTRAAARTAFHALEAALGDWTVPAFILRALSDWHFDSATAAMAAATQVHDAAAQLATILPGVDGLQGKARTLLESATSEADIDAALAAAQDRVDAAGSVVAAQAAFAAPRDLAVQAGMFGTDLQPTLDAAVQAIRDDDPAAARSSAEAVMDALGAAQQQGQLRLALAIGIPILLLLLLVTFLVLRRRRRRPAVAAAASVGTFAVDVPPTALEPAWPATDLRPPAPDAPAPAGPSPAPETPPSSTDPEGPIGETTTSHGDTSVQPPSSQSGPPTA